MRELGSLVNGHDARQKISDMSNQIMDAQQFAINTQEEYLEQSKKIEELEKELVRLKDFRSEKKNYELKALGNTAFSYVYKQPEGSSEPIHWLCETCYNQDRKSILQYYGRHIIDDRKSIWKCHVCNSEIHVSYTISPN